MPNKYRYEYVIQGRYSGAWEDETAEEARPEALTRLREYRENMPEYPHRLIRRRELIKRGRC
jgi:hypothetical protein